MILRKEGVHKKENDDNKEQAMICSNSKWQHIGNRVEMMNNKMAKKVVSLSTLLLKKGHIEGVEKCWVNE